MENLIKQQHQKRGVKFSGVQDSREVLNGTMIPPQKRESFKRDMAAQKNWFQRQFSSQMSSGSDSEDCNYTTAIAAATFAIYSADPSSFQQNQTNNNFREGFRTSMTRANTRKDDPTWLPESGAVSRRLSRNETKGQVETSMRKPMGREDRSSSSIRSRPPATRGENLARSSTRGTSADSKIDAWEKTEAGKILKRYEQKNTRIVAWENEKKMKAKLKMERIKGELEQKKARNAQHYQSKLARINHIAGGAKAQLLEKMKYDELKIHERAKKMRSSGEVHASCLCF